MVYGGLCLVKKYAESGGIMSNNLTVFSVIIKAMFESSGGHGFEELLGNFFFKRWLCSLPGKKLYSLSV